MMVARNDMMLGAKSLPVDIVAPILRDASAEASRRCDVVPGVRATSLYTVGDWFRGDVGRTCWHNPRPPTEVVAVEGLIVCTDCVDQLPTAYEVCDGCGRRGDLCAIELDLGVMTYRARVCHRCATWTEGR